MKFPVLIPNIFDHPFTYTSDINLKVGDYVEVPFGKKKVNGIVWNEFEQDQSKRFKLKSFKALGGAYAVEKISAGNKNIFVLKLNTSGVFQWVKTYGGTLTDIGYGIAVDSSSNVHITGSFRGTVDFGGGDITSAASSSDIFVLKLNSSGVFQWVKTFGGTLSGRGYGIAVDSSSNTYITGTFLGTVDFGGGNITAAVLIDTFVIKTNSSGVFQWVKTYGGSASEFGYRIAVDSSDNVYITGHFTGTLDFGGGNVTSVGNEDIFVLKLNSSGVFQWVKTYGDTSADFGYGIAVDSSSNVYITGYFVGTVDFGAGDITSAGAGDIVVFKTNSSGGGIE